MRILIVDDDPQKVGLIRSFLREMGLADGDILIAEHAAGARKHLDQVAVDIMLIDVLLPVRSGSKPHGEHSLELLRQIVDDGTTPSPRYILGITASQDALAEYGDDFRSLVTHILHVSPAEDAWRASLNALLLLFRRVEESQKSNDYDICVLTALRTPELDAVYSTWELKLGDEQILSRTILHRTGTLILDGAERRIVCAHLSQMGPIAATHATTALLNAFRPRIILMTGICGGFEGHAQIGDVVIAEKSWDWQAGKWTDMGTLATAMDQRDGAAELIAEARGLDDQLRNIHATYGGPRPADAPRLILGPMVTGSSVVASLDIQKVFRNQHRKMAAVDMECYGMYFAAENHSGAPVKAICVKAVSDLADRAKGDDFQMYCSHLGALLSLELVRRHFRR